MEIFTIDFNKKRLPTGIKTEDVESLRVMVLSGDEILNIKTKDGMEYVFDAFPDGRYESLYDGEYHVPVEYLERWCKRKDSYDWFGKIIRNQKGKGILYV